MLLPSTNDDGDGGTTRHADAGEPKCHPSAARTPRRARPNGASGAADDRCNRNIAFHPCQLFTERSSAAAKDFDSAHDHRSAILTTRRRTCSTAVAVGRSAALGAASTAALGAPVQPHAAWSGRVAPRRASSEPARSRCGRDRPYATPAASASLSELQASWPPAGSPRAAGGGAAQVRIVSSPAVYSSSWPSRRHSAFTCATATAAAAAMARRPP